MTLGFDEFSLGEMPEMPESPPQPGQYHRSFPCGIPSLKIWVVLKTDLDILSISVYHIVMEDRLSKIELEILVELLRISKGDNRAVKDKIIEYYLPLVPQLTARFIKYGIDRDDLIQEGSIGVIKAINKFHSLDEFHVRFVNKCINEQLIDFYRSEKRGRRLWSTPDQG